MAMDKSCLLAALLFLVGHILRTVVFFTDRPDIFKLKSVDPDYIKERWTTGRNGVEFAGEILVALAWFALTIPIIQLAWVLSRGGKRKLPLHATMVLLAIGGSFMELITRLLQLGMWGIMGWITSEFNLSTWTGSSINDDIGWRVIELIGTVVRGMTFWVDAFEWLALSGIITAAVVSVETLPTSTRGLPIYFSYLGCPLIFLCLMEFLCDVFRLVEWRTFSMIAAGVSLGTTTIFLPAWLLVLGSWLPSITPVYNEKEENYNLNEEKLPRINEGESNDLI